MKKTVILTVLTVFALGLRAADYQYLVFTLTDGTTKAVTATDLNIAFSNDNLVATNGSETLATLPLNTLTKMEFSTSGEGGATGIESISVDQLVTDDATVIYDMQGRQMPRGAQLPQGVYILKNNDRTLKVHIR
jgi:hypothetical protein